MHILSRALYGIIFVLKNRVAHSLSFLAQRRYIDVCLCLCWRALRISFPQKSKMEDEGTVLYPSSLSEPIKALRL